MENQSRNKNPGKNSHGKRSHGNKQSLKRKPNTFPRNKLFQPRKYLKTMSAGTTDTLFSETKKYKVDLGAIDLGRTYEHKILAFIALRCLRQDFDDLQIAANALELRPLDDIVVIGKKNCGNDITILLQLKHQKDGKYLSNKQLPGKYSLLTYHEFINTLKRDLKDNDKKGIIKDLGMFNNIHFVLYTNKGKYKYKGLDKDSCGTSNCNPISFLNATDDNSNIYKLEGADQFYLFVNQSHANHLEKVIETEIAKVFQHFGLMHPNIKNDGNIKHVSKAFIEFVTKWSIGELGGYYFLTKHAILYKLSEILLCAYEVDLSQDIIRGYYPLQKLWSEVVNDKKITIVDSDEEVISFLKLYVGSELASYGCKLDKKWCENFSSEEQMLFYTKNENFKKAMVKIVHRHGQVTLSNIYKCLWFNECVPLLLKVNTVDDYEIILKILEMCSFKLKVIIVTEVKLNPTRTGFDYFLTLSDLNNEKRLNILDNSVKLQGRLFNTFKELVDDSLYPLIKCNAIIKILIGNFNIGTTFRELPNYFIKRRLLKVFLKMDVLGEIQDETFIIENKEQIHGTLDEFKRQLNEYILNERKAREKPSHYLISYGNLLEWKGSSGGTDNIKRYRYEHNIKFEDSNELNEYIDCSNTINIISATPGMGKSTLLDYIAFASTEMWVLNIKLNLHEKYYDTKYFQTLKTQDYLKYFNDFVLENGDCSNVELAQALFQKFVSKQRVLVLFDAIDEVPISFKKKVIEMINSIHKDGFSVWLTTRPHLAAELENVFSTISTTLKPFNIDDQKIFLNQYFKYISKSEKLDFQHNQHLIENFVEKLLEASRKNLNDTDGEFTGIPLQTKLLAEAFRDQLQETLRNGTITFDDKFNLLHLYKEFIKRKESESVKDMGIFQYHQQLFALKLLFDPKILFRLNINAELNNYFNNHETYIASLQQNGVIQIQRNVQKDPKFQVNFVHRTFAEYLAARWIFDNFNGNCENSKLTSTLLLEERFRRNTNYGLLFRMFDCMVAGDSQLHLSVINGRFDRALELLHTDVDLTDQCGRTFLHIVAISCGTDFTKEPHRVRNEMVEFVDKIQYRNIKNVKDNFGYTPLDYALKNSAFSLSNKLCEKSKQLTVDLNKVNFYEIYHKNPIIDPKYKSLLNTILPLLLCQAVLEHGLFDDGPITNYFIELPEKKEALQIINEYAHKLDIKTVSDFLIKMNIQSPARTEPYYYDLSFAAAFGSILNVQKLISSECKQNNFYTPLYCAIKYNRLEIFQLLLKEENITEPCIRDLTPLHCAAEIGNIEIVQELLLHHADVNAKTNNGDSPLNLAICRKHIEVAKVLVAHETVRVNMINNYNCFPIYYASIYGLHDLIPDLTKCVDVNHRGIYDDTPLLVAITNNHVETVRVLLDYGADCNIPDKSNYFPIHAAAEEGAMLILPYILSKTSQGVNVQTKEGRTALHLSIYKMLDSSEGLKNRGDIVKILLDDGADPNIQDCGGNTVLHYLCQYLVEEEDKNVVKLLKEKGADVNLKNKLGQTPLHTLLCNRRPNNNELFSLILSLVTNDANVNIRDAEGNTALHYVIVRGAYEPDEEIMYDTSIYLLNIGSSSTLKNLKGKTALDLAQESNYLKIVSLFQNGS